MKLHIRGGRLIDPANQLDAVLDLFIDDGNITAIGHPEEGFVADQVIDASGQIVCPGFIDLQANLCEPGFTQKGTVATESKAAAAGGVTTLCCPPSTRPILDTPAVAQLVLERAAATGLTRVLPIGALTKGLEGEQLSNMVGLRDSGCVALSNARQGIPSTQTLLRCLEYAATYDLLLYVEPQDIELSDNGYAHEGEVSFRLGLPGIPETAETVDLARYLLLAEQTGARIHVGQVTTPRAVDMIIDARARGVKVSVDVAIQNLLLTDENLIGYDSAYHLMPPLRTARHRDGLIQHLLDGQIEAICSNHSPQDAASKEAPLGATEPGMIGLQTLLSLGLNLVDHHRLPLSALIALLTTGPAHILADSRGQLSLGSIADICIFDPQAGWVLDDSSNESKARNTPFWGKPLKGRVTYTLLAGQQVYPAG